MKSYQEVHGITSITYNTTMRLYHQEVHRITSITYDTTMRSHQEVHGITSITSNTTMKFYQEFHGITSTHTTTMSLQPTIDLSCITISCQHPTNQSIMIMHLFIPSSSIPVSLYHIEHTKHHTYLLKATNHLIIRNIHVSNQLCQSRSG